MHYLAAKHLQRLCRPIELRDVGCRPRVFMGRVSSAVLLKETLVPLARRAPSSDRAR